MPTTPLLEANEPTDEHQHFEPTRDDDDSPIEPPITSGPAVSETETAAATEEVVKTEEPANNNPPTGPRRSTRARTQTKAYVPSMTGKSYQCSHPISEDEERPKGGGDSIYPAHSESCNQDMGQSSHRRSRVRDEATALEEFIQASPLE